MKKIYLAAMAVAALTVSSCSQDEVLNENPSAKPQAIEFGIYTGKNAQARGLETVTDVANGKTAIKETGFGITAFYTAGKTWAAWLVDDAITNKTPNFMLNQEVTIQKDETSGWGKDKWGYSPVKYWPTMKTDYLSFFAYAPYSTSSVATGLVAPSDKNAVKTPTVDFSIAKDASNMVDFVAGNAIDEQHNQTGTTVDAQARTAVNFTLYHELTRLNFQAKVDENLTPAVDGKTYVIVKTAKLDGKADGQYYTKATYTFNDADMTTDVNTWGKWDFTKATKMSADYPIDIVADVAQTTLFGNKYTSTGVAVQDNVVENSEAVSLFETNHYLFLIPASETGLAANTASVTFTYDIVTIDNTLADGFSCTSSTKTVYLPEGIMQQRKAYNIIFTFNIDAIEVSASVDPGWSDTTNVEDIPYSPDSEVKGE